jgi:hypothetical protein
LNVAQKFTVLAQKQTLKHACLLALPLLFAPALWGQKDRLSRDIHDSDRIILRGSVHPLAAREFDQGPVDPNLTLDTMVIGLKKSQQQQAELDQLLNDLQDPKSPRYHQFLTPEEYADRFGISQSDIAKINGWLETSGFSVLSVSRGRDMIMFSGTTGQVEQVLRTPIHRYRVNGKEHHAAAVAPSIPREMADLVDVVRGMDDFQPSRRTRKKPIAKVSDVLSGARSLVSDGFGDNLLVPADIAAIYNLGPMYQAGIDGTGVTIAIPGGSDIDLTDIQAFRKMLSLPANDPVKLLVPKMRNPARSIRGSRILTWSGPERSHRKQVSFTYSPSTRFCPLFTQSTRE